MMPSPAPTATRNLLTWASSRPLLVVALVAALTRVAVAVTSFVVNKGFLIPDEQQYVELAGSVAAGDGAEAWFPGYGGSLYHTTYAFTAPLARLYEALWESRLIGQLWAAALGVAAAVLLTWLARQMVGPRWALAVGLLAAVFPSQVLWSSVVLRESAVWLALVVMACGVLLAVRSSGWRVLPPTLLIAAGLIALGYLRTQSMVATAWALIATALILALRNPPQLTATMIGIGLFAPLFVGHGIGGWLLVEQSVPALNRTRTMLGFGAESSFTEKPEALQPFPQRQDRLLPDPRIRPEARVPPVPGPLEDAQGSDSGAAASRGDRPATDPRAPAPMDSEEALQEAPMEQGETGEQVVVDPFTGTHYVVEETASASLRHLPRGFVGTLFRPWPVESTSGIGPALARAENLLWYPLYVLAIIGTVCGIRRQKLRELSFPILSAAAVLGVSFLIAGNAGTAFRHRGQAFWAIALLAVVGAASLHRIWCARRGTAGPELHDVVEPLVLDAV